jgi:hypothetical protein
MGAVSVTGFSPGRLESKNVGTRYRLCLVLMVNTYRSNHTDYHLSRSSDEYERRTLRPRNPSGVIYLQMRG